MSDRVRSRCAVSQSHTNNPAGANNLTGESEQSHMSEHIGDLSGHQCLTIAPAFAT